MINDYPGIRSVSPAAAAGRRLKIVADDKIPFLRGVMEPYADIAYLPGAAITADDVREADVLFTRTRTRCDEALLTGSRVRLIVTATIGFDHIDTGYCQRAGIRWVNAPGCNAASVRQYIAAALVTIVRQRGLRLTDTTLGIIGVGHVGRGVADAARALGMRVLLNDPPREEREGSDTFTSLDELLRQSDIVTCHTPLTTDGPYPTHHLASAHFFDRMKDGAAFINSSRGSVVDSAALRDAALRGKLAAFVLDTWEGEPNIDRTLLRDALLATPHIAGYSADGKANGTAVCVRTCSQMFGIDALADWFPPTLPAPPMPTDFAIDATGRTDEEVFYEAVTHTYPIEADSARLKTSPETFERQRGDYWTRREFPCFRLRLTGASRRVEEGLRRLGFRVHI